MVEKFLAFFQLFIYVYAYFTFDRSLETNTGFTGGSDSKESACSEGDSGSIPESRRSPGKGNGYPLLYSCLENSLDFK